MNDFNMWLLAQATDSAPSQVESVPQGSETTVPADPNAGARPAPQTGFGTMQIIFLVMMVFIVVWMFRGPQKQKQQHQKMLASLKKNDKVRTIGGIIGIVTDIDGETITLKVDESNNTKIKVVSSAIGRNMSQEKE